MRLFCVVFIATLATGLISQSSNAAELPLKAPVAASAYNWSGFYIGANAGYGHASANWTNRQNTAPFADYAVGDTFSSAADGVIGGGQVGYNFQSGRWVYGLETVLDGSAIDGRQVSNTPFGANDDNFELRIRALVMASGRIGYAWDNFLAYGKAGYALANVKVSVSDTGGVNTGSGSDSQWRNGPALGVGFEYGVAPNLSVGLEYDYIRLNSGSYELGGGAGSYLWDVDICSLHVVMLRFNYRFAGLR